ncbi:hypothetical protein EMQU_1624 [Enterococcus mundtii QU 25]|nr:hypothetical protein EMQU_1624 [Enterococcus mundtii QU 25]
MIRTCPPSKGRIVVKILQSVDFPAPLEPKRTKISPRLTVKSTPFNTCFLPKSFLDQYFRLFFLFAWLLPRFYKIIQLYIKLEVLFILVQYIEKKVRV